MSVEAASLHHWSTDTVPADQRYEFYQDVLRNAVTPMEVRRSSGQPLDTAISSASHEHISFVLCTGSPHRTIRTAQHIEQSGERSFHLLTVRTSAVQLIQRHRIALAPHDCVFVDSQIPFELNLPQTYDIAHLRFSETFIRKWVPRSGALVGRRIASTQGWGGALSSFARQLAPDFIARAPLPLSVISDHLGSLIALASDEISGHVDNPDRTQRSTAERIRDRIVERCTELSLTATDVSQSLNLSVRTLHRTLAACGVTFGQLLMDARVDVAMRMLTSPLFNRVTTAEVGRRAGFLDASHFTRVFRGRTGRTPSAVRDAHMFNLR